MPEACQLPVTNFRADPAAEEARQHQPQLRRERQGRRQEGGGGEAAVAHQEGVCRTRHAQVGIIHGHGEALRAAGHDVRRRGPKFFQGNAVQQAITIFYFYAENGDRSP